MATNQTYALFTSAFKTYYPKPSDLRSAVYEARPVLTMMEKDVQFVGESFKQPWIISDPVGASASYTGSLSNYVNANYKHILVSPVALYQPVGVETLAILGSRNERGAQLKAAEREIKGGLNNLANRISFGFFRSSAGDIGQVSSDTNTATTTLKLSERADIHELHKGMILVFSATRTGAVGSALTVVSVDRNAGTAVLSGTLDSVSAAAGYFIFVSGSAQNNSTANCALGLGDYIPATAPTSGDTFTGSSLDRSADTRMSGVRHDGSAQTIEAGILDTIAEIQFNNGDPNLYLINPLQGSKLVQALGSKVFFDELKSGDKPFGGKKMMAYLGSSVCELKMENHCPQGYGFALTKDTWCFATYGELVKVVDTDGLKSRQSLTFDGVQSILASYYNVICRAPWANGRHTLPTLG